jgi:hypothetical protein
MLKELTLEDGRLRSASFVGGYPIFYLDHVDQVLCPECAKEQLDGGEVLRAAEVNWEDEELYCEGCNLWLEPAYEGRDD